MNTERTCENCKYRDACKKDVGMIFGFCLTDFEPIEGSKTVNRYSFEELEKAAFADNATQENINALGEWYEQYGDMYWNGEYFGGKYNGYEYEVRRVYSEANEYGDYDVIGYEIR